MKEIPLTRGWVALVDDQDYRRLASSKWHVLLAGRQAYAVRNLSKKGGLKGRTARMHCEILGPAPPGMEIDHIRHPPLVSMVIDNQRSNLRFVTRRQNNANRRKFYGLSCFKGVSFHRASGLWRATIKIAGRHHNVGYFHLEVHAALAYDLAAVGDRGGHALTNFPVPGSASFLFGGGA